MTYIPKKYKSLILLIILVQIQAAYSNYLTEKKFYSHKDEGMNGYKFKDTGLKEFYYLPQSLQILDKPNIFFRNTRLSNQPRMLNIDLSRLRKDKDLPIAHGNMRHKSPIGLLGIDISVLSHNPDPSLPIAVIHPQHSMNGKAIMSYDFDSKYDRLPVIKTRPIQSYFSPKKPTTILPIMHIPLKVMTTYHSILTNKKQDFDFGSSMSDDIESEQRYTANFILHLLYQLSSNYENIN